MKKISVLISGRHATSISLEDEFYAALLQITQRENISVNKLITKIDQTSRQDNLSAAIRLFSVIILYL